MMKRNSTAGTKGKPSPKGAKSPASPTSPAPPAVTLPPALSTVAAKIFTYDVMGKFCGPAVTQRFKDALASGEPTSDEDQRVIEKGLFLWAAELKAVNYAHWFFPLRFGGGVLGSTAGMKYDCFVDYDWGAGGIPGNKAFIAKMPKGRVFNGETDGSSFPNGGLRQTHTAAAFTSWDRGSPPFVHDGTLYIPCAFVSHYGAALDDKTPLLRAQDAVHREGLRLLKNIGGYDEVKQVVSYLGWEQEFFVISKATYLARPDLRATGRTLIGAPPSRGQQADLNYFAPMPLSVKNCMDDIQAALLAVGCPLNVYHNEVAPGQHEISPIFSMTNISSDQNQIAMQICNDVAAKHDLVILFHEKPFAGLNGSGKHNNWSVGTDTGVNFFSPGSTEKQSTLFTVALACLTYALNVHNEIIRCSVAHAGNDHRLGAQEAPPAIVSLYPGTTFEAKVKEIIAGGELAGYQNTPGVVNAESNFLNPITTGLEDRNRTAPFPFCGNRFEFRAVGSSQNCAFPMAMIDTAFADGMAVLSDLIEGGMDLRSAVAKLFEENERVIFCGNGYSAEWPVEAEKRGLPNLKDSVAAAGAFSSEKSKALFTKMKVFSEAEVDARQEVMYENYATVLEIETQTLIEMVRTGVEPAVAQDLAIYAAGQGAAYSRRKDVYDAITASTDELEGLLGSLPEEPKDIAQFMAETVKPKTLEVRSHVDKAELLCKADLWPYPSYSDILLAHQVSASLK